MKLIRKRGDTSNILQIFIQDSSSTTGAGLTGLTNASAGLTAYYHRDVDTTATAISLVSMTVGTFTSSGFKEIDSTNMPGWYQFCPPDAALSATSTPKSVGIQLKGATNMAQLNIEIQLIAADVEDATALGLSRIDAAITTRLAPTTAGRTLDVTATGEAGIDWGNIGSPTTTVNLSGTSTLALEPTTAGRKLDVSVGGEAGVDWANVGSPTTVVGLSGTTIKTATDVETDTADIQSRLPAALTAGGNMKSDALAISGDTVAADTLESAFDGTGGVSMTANVAGSVASLGVGAIGTNSFQAGAIDAAAIASDAIGANELAATAAEEIADAVLNRNIEGGSNAGRLVKESLYVNRNKVSIAAGTMTVYASDDTTTAFTAAVTTTAGNPISEVDPA
jgi:hypothetical protein